MKIVVFDLDETLGYFTQLSIFWDSLSNYVKNINKKLSQNDFNNILDLFPEFLRPNIINILTYLKKKKQSNSCYKMIIYTNNNGSKEWSNLIKNFFEDKMKYKLIDQIISAYKINGKQIEICRTTYDKTHKDFIKCTKLPPHSEICFLDDTFYPKMSNDNIYYINVKPYYYDLQFNYMIDTFINSNIGKKWIKEENFFKQFMLNKIKSYQYQIIIKNKNDYETDKLVGQHVLQHLKIFFRKRKTFRLKKNYNNKTHKLFTQ
jgi:hypothetical protein